MPVFNNHTVFEIARGVEAFLSLELGITRGRVQGTRGLRVREPDEVRRRMSELERALAAKEREVAQLRARPDETRDSTPTGGIAPHQLVWIFGTARVGSTWLGAMMGELENCTVWHEPLVGQLFSIYFRADHRRGKHFILGPQHKETWLKSMRNVVLDGANARFPAVAEGGHLVIKEPNGSIGAPLLMEALPESRMIVLIRDPRDVVASALDASREDGWLSVRRGESRRDKIALAEENPTALISEVARRYLQYVGKSKEAYDAHEGPKMLIKYEELRTDPLGTMRRICSASTIPVDEAGLARAVERHSWENLAQHEKGDRKFRRKAMPGGWREDLTPEQAKMVEEITAPLFDEFYAG